MNGLVRHLAVVISLAALAGLIPAPSYSRAAQTTPAQAGVVVRFGDGSVRTACVDLGADGSATGEEVLRNSGLAVTIAFDPGAGSAVCRIEQEGCDYPREGCFCQCTLAPGQACRYWSYYHLGPNGWAFSNQGASSYIVRAGAVEGWSWGPGGVGQGVEPPIIPFPEVCAVAAPPTQTPTPSVTSTPTATLTPTEQPSATVAPAGASPTPMILPVASSTPPPPPPTQPARTATPTNTSPPALVATPLPEATAAPPTLPTETPPTVAPTAPSPVVVATELPATAPAAPPTESPTELPLPEASTSAPAGGAALTATPAALHLPLVARTEPEQLQPTPETQAVAPTLIQPGSTAAAPARELQPTPTADVPGESGFFWFLAFSAALGGGIVLARVYGGRRNA